MSYISSKKIRVCALMLDSYDTNPGQRFRLEQWEPYLENAGIEIDYFAFTDSGLREIIYKPGNVLKKARGLIRATHRRLHTIKQLSDYDAVYLFRAASMIGPPVLENRISKAGIPLIYDFDDSIYLTNTSKANQKFGWLKFPQKTARICELSSVVTVGNSHLAKFAGKYNKNVSIIPTSIDTNKYKPLKKKSDKKDKINVGWTGSSTSQYHLEEFEETLRELLKKRKDVEIRVISNREPSFKNIPYSWRAWAPETEVEEISKIDIGIMPTPNDEWSRGKCALKALQYMSLGIPAICTDMGANRDVIEQGENGYLAKTQEDWLRYFDIIIDDIELRKKLGDEARRTVVDRYSMEKCAELFADVVHKTIKK